MLFRVLGLTLAFTTVCDSFANQNDIERITTTASRSQVNADPLPLVVSSITQAELDLIAPT
ncbi:MAG: hypothetical protein ACPG5Z_13930, partial [Pseudoalteromonas sp.]